MTRIPKLIFEFVMPIKILQLVDDLIAFSNLPILAGLSSNLFFLLSQNDLNRVVKVAIGLTTSD